MMGVQGQLPLPEANGTCRGSPTWYFGGHCLGMAAAVDRRSAHRPTSACDLPRRLSDRMSDTPLHGVPKEVLYQGCSCLMYA